VCVKTHCHILRRSWERGFHLATLSTAGLWTTSLVRRVKTNETRRRSHPLWQCCPPRTERHLRPRLGRGCKQSTRSSHRPSHRHACQSQSLGPRTVQTDFIAFGLGRLFFKPNQFVPIFLETISCNSYVLFPRGRSIFLIALSLNPQLGSTQYVLTPDMALPILLCITNL